MKGNAMKPLLPRSIALGLAFVLVIAWASYHDGSILGHLFLVLFYFCMGTLWYAGWMVKKSDHKKTDEDKACPDTHLGKEEILKNKKVEAVRRLAACHEAGHAIVAWFMPPIQNISYVQVKRKLIDGEPSALCRLPDCHRTDKEYLKARLAVLVAGPVAIELAYRAGKLGSENDVLEANDIAQKMICDYGHCDALGNRQFPGYAIGICTTETKKKIRKEIRLLLIEAVKTAQQLIIAHQNEWAKLVESLMDHETQRFDEIKKIFGPRPRP